GSLQMEIRIRTPDTRCLISSCEIPANSLSNLLSYGDLWSGGSRAPPGQAPAQRIEIPKTLLCRSVRSPRRWTRLPWVFPRAAEGHRGAPEQGVEQPGHAGQAEIG